ERGQIAAYRTADLKNFEYLGVVLEAPFHLSFPFVFAEGSSVFMVPESLADSSVALYQFDAFPFKLRMVRTLLKGDFVDSHLFHHNNKWFLFTTHRHKDELQIYFTDNL